ncbi:class I SAM-dependent methyltransferase, partial [Methanoregula sp.]|uniref:class I SAM-dependent methyltransferase n=1 Tax=Methanoregula sp. TaxID=2052170 RepID=UPI00236FE007
MEAPSSKKEYPLKKNSQFVFDQEHAIYVHPDNITIEYHDGGEAYILESMKKVKDLSSHSPEFKQYIKDWPTRYHFSNKRINFLEAIKVVLPKNADVLEIGSGCGTITRWLGEKFHSVDALEGNTQRAGITRYRTRDLENVTVYCGDVLATDFDKKYDIITLIGSLEYIPLYDNNHDNPKDACTAILTRLKSSLKENGILLIAIENKFGAKYFSGCKEDHTGREFEGIIGYPDKTPITFSRNEMESMLSQTGFEHTQFYHVFPDYKMTETIIPENPEVLSLYPYNWIRTPFEDYFGVRDYLFQEFLFLKNITNSGLLWHFSNSFVILATKTNTKKLDPPWLIKKYHCNNKLDSKFTHDITLLKEERMVCRDAKYVVNRNPQFGGISYYMDNDFEYNLKENQLEIGEALIYYFYIDIIKSNPDFQLKHGLHILYENLISQFSIGKTDDEGYPFIKGEAIDFTVWNLIITSDKQLHFIDRKWKSKKPITAEYILFRNLFALYDFLTPFIKDIQKSDFIIDSIRIIYPQYSYDRLIKNLHSEEIFQSFVSGTNINLQIDVEAHQLCDYRYTKIKQLGSELEELRLHYEAMTAQRDVKDTQIKQLGSELEELR